MHEPEEKNRILNLRWSDNALQLFAITFCDTFAL
jgi:hypothetical protein